VSSSEIGKKKNELLRSEPYEFNCILEIKGRTNSRDSSLVHP